MTSQLTPALWSDMSVKNLIRYPIVRVYFKIDLLIANSFFAHLKELTNIKSRKSKSEVEVKVKARVKVLFAKKIT
jgi:hypothetical protein